MCCDAMRWDAMLGCDAFLPVDQKCFRAFCLRLLFSLPIRAQLASRLASRSFGGVLLMGLVYEVTSGKTTFEVASFKRLS